jgi:hypothetical protein
MTQQHPITPPPELVKQWQKRFEQGANIYQLFTSIFQAGADQELEACCEWLRTESKTALWQTEALRVARRPKPPSLKEQALQALAEADVGLTELEWPQYSDTIRRALEQLPDNN